MIRAMNGAKLSGFLSNVGWVRRAVCAVTHQPCRQAHLKQTRCVASQRLVGYAKNANPPYIELNLAPFIRAMFLFVAFVAFGLMLHSRPLAADSFGGVAMKMADNQVSQPTRVATKAKASARASASTSSSADDHGKGECQAESNASATAQAGDQQRSDQDHDRKVGQGGGCSAKAESRAEASAGERRHE